MTPNEFIISKLKSFIHDFPETRVRYEHDKLSDTHFVEVVPNEVYNLSERYLAWESKMFDEFVEHFPHENIGFISDDALVGLENIDFEQKGLLFDLIWISSINSIIIKETNLEISSSVSSVTIQDITISTDINRHFSNNPINGLPDIGQFTYLPKAS